jgi:hypothetical protein
VTAARQEPVRYGDLLAMAAASLAQARTELYRSPLGSPAQARAIAAAHQDLLAALGEQLRRLYRPQLSLDDSLHGTTHRRDGAATALLAELEAVGKPVGWELKAGSTEGAAASLARAAREVRAATDVIATHVDVAGTPRTPDASRLFDPNVRGDAVLALAGLSIDAHRLRGSLELRLHELAQQQPVRALPSVPDTEALVEIAEGVLIASRDAPSADSPGLLSLGLARARLRRDHPADELSDRITRLRRMAWELPDRDHVGVATLSDYAALGVITHAHAIATLTSVALEDGVPREQVLEPYRNAHRQWLSIRQQLLPMRTATPAMQGVRADLLAVKRILEVIAPIPAAASTPRSAVEPDSATVEAVLDATRPMPEIAGWNGNVVERLAANDELIIRARALSGDELSERAEFAAISLANGYVPTPRLLIDALGQVYRLAGEGLETTRAAPAPDSASLSAVAAHR